MDNFEKLQQLKELLDEGILTPEEYEKSKAQILNHDEKGVEEKSEKEENKGAQITNNISSKLKGKKVDKRTIIIGAICVAVVLVLIITGSVIRANRAEQERATIATYSESLEGGRYEYKEGGSYFITLSFWNNGDLYVITNDFVAGERNSFLSMDSYYNWYNGHTYWAVQKDSKGYYVSTGLSPYNKLYLPDDPTTEPSSLTDENGNVFEQ